MPIVKQLAEALAQEPRQVASALGLADDGAEDKQVAEAIMAAVGAAREPPAEVLPEAVANALGVEPGADEVAVKAKILALQAPGAGLMQVCSALGIDQASELEAALTAIGELQKDHRKNEAEALVDEAIEAGKLPPAQRDFWMNSAQADIEAATAAIGPMPVMTHQDAHPNAAGTGNVRVLSDEEKSVCGLMGLTAEQFLAVDPALN